jgi:hypothetical protein
MLQEAGQDFICRRRMSKVKQFRDVAPQTANKV